MYQSFLAIISLLAGVYAFWTKQVRMGLGFLIFAGAFFLLIPNLFFGVKTDIAGASAMVLFVIGSLVVIWKKRPKKTIEEQPKETVDRGNE